MNVSLTPQLEALVRQKVETGLHNNASEVVREALRLLEARDRHVQRIRDSVAEGFAAIERGEGIELTDDYWAALDREVDERLRRGDTPSPDVCP